MAYNGYGVGQSGCGPDGQVIGRLGAYSNSESGSDRRGSALRAARGHQGRGLLERMAQKQVNDTMFGNGACYPDGTPMREG